MNFKLPCCNNNLRHTFLFVWLSIWTLFFFLICYNFNIWLSFDYSIFSFLSSFLFSFLFSSLLLLFYCKTVYWLPRIFFLLLLELFYLKVSLSNITDWSHFRRSFLREHIDIVHVILQLTTYKKPVTSIIRQCNHWEQRALGKWFELWISQISLRTKIY